MRRRRKKRRRKARRGARFRLLRKKFR